ncbi:hypothetical protein [Candidatus Chloroploca asiatica]|uniref:Uncharacterized protein n=1 Tax=Candidatus Chloroploca asiatica TaxID=1506545 RepID=A0A2H3KG12_9CHLR|nr:hypothetical protein [Candidatus Chloroploca asiatica]PDV96655.1 hypothetical protein A9Q02_20505 [Candidatus Chloroploca asiatica]
MNTYRLSAAGRRLVLILLIAALLIWAFAIWSFASTLRLSYNPLEFWPSLQATLASGPGIGQLVPALLMFVLIIATPFLIWNLLIEWAAAYTPTADGLRFASLGVQIDYPWAAVSDVRRTDDDREEPFDELVLTTDCTTQIHNPLVRLLYRQAYGSLRLPIYAGVEARDELLAEIRRATQMAIPLAETAPAV